MSDIFREVEEDVRRERLEKLWKAYGDYAMALLALLVLGVAGWQVWTRYEASQRAKASTEYVAAEQVNTPAQAVAAFDALSKTAPGGYGQLALLAKANAMPATGQVAEAIALYKDIAAKDGGPVGSAARIRAGWLMADTGSHDELVALLDPINTSTNPWREMAREILAYSNYKAGKTKEAAAAFDALAADPEAPDGMKSRARAFAAFLHNGGAADFGTVPPTAAAPLPGTPPGPAPEVTAPKAPAKP